MGTHQELLARRGLYAALEQAQGQREALTQALAESGAIVAEDAP
jgi:hypothetical protein